MAAQSVHKTKLTKTQAEDRVAKMEAWESVHWHNLIRRACDIWGFVDRLLVITGRRAWRSSTTHGRGRSLPRRRRRGRLRRRRMSGTTSR